MADDVVAKARALRPSLEAALRKGRREFALSSALGLLLSAAGFALLGFVAYFLLVYATARWEGSDGRPFSVPLGAFLLAYSLVFVVLVAVSVLYQPKDKYNLGLPMHGGGAVDNPLTLQDDFDRFHVALGFLLLVPGFVRLNLLGLLEYLRTAGPVKDPALAAAVLLLARDGAPLSQLASALHPFEEQEVRDALGYLKLLNWIKVHRTGKTWTAAITDRGKDVLAGTSGS